MKLLLLLLPILGLGVFVMSSCQSYGPRSSGGGGTYSTGYHSGPSYARKIHPRQHGRHKDGFRTHAEKKYYRPL